MSVERRDPKRIEAEGTEMAYAKVPNDVLQLIMTAREIAPQHAPGSFSESFLTGLSLARLRMEWREPATEGESRSSRKSLRLRLTKEAFNELVRIEDLFKEDRWRVISAAIRLAAKDRLSNLFSEAARAVAAEQTPDQNQQTTSLRPALDAQRTGDTRPAVA